MKIAFNPSTVAALTSPPDNKDITFDLKGRNIFARGVKFYGTDTNTWRDIKVNNVSIGSHTLDLRNGSNTTLTNINGVVTINSTWRPVVDSLTSDSTTSSLSAKQGKVLKALIDGKSDSGHTHDGRYLKLTGGIMTGTINRSSGGSTISGRDHAIIRLTYAPGGSSWNPIACVDTETGTWTLGHLSSGDSDTNFHFCFSTNADYNAGNNNGNYVTLRNKVGTIALLSEIPDKNSWNYDDRYLKLTGGTMNRNARIGHGSGNLYIGNSGNDGWVAVQNICSQNSIGDGNWSLRTDGTASFQSIKFPYNRCISQVENGSNSPLRGIKLPDLQSNGIGIFSRVGNGGDEGGIILSEDTCVIYNSFDTGWGLSVRDKDLNETDISSDDTVAFGIRQNYKLYSRGGFEKKDSSDDYVLLGGGGHKLESALSVASASVASKVYGQVGDTGSHELVRCDMNNDQFRIIAGSNGNNNGWAEIATADDGNEPIYVRQYAGVFSSVVRTLTLLDANGYTHFPSYINIGGNENNNSSPDRVWGSTGSDSYLRSYRTSALNVNYAASAGNAYTLDGYPENSFLRYRDTTSTNGLDTLWSLIGIRSYHNALPDGLSGLYTYGQVISFPGYRSRMDIFTNHVGSTDTVNLGLWWRSGWDDDKKTWRRIIDSGNIGSLSVNYANSAGNADTATNAYHLRINSANTWSTWYWAGLSGLPSWLWGSNDETNMYVWDPNNFNVHTALYLRSLGNLNCQTGRTLNYGDVYTYNTHSSNTGSPTTYSSVIGFGRGTAGTVEIAGGWCDTNLYWRSLRDCCEDWHSWRTVLDSSNYTGFINNYYWANVKISTSSSTTTSPIVSNLTATNSIRMGNILLQNTNEINNSDNGSLYLNYRSSGNVSLCQGGGNVGIGTTSPSYKLDVNGLMGASGFHHSSVNSDNYMLLAGGGYKSFGGSLDNPIFLGYLNLDHGDDGTISSSFYCLGYSVSFTYTRGGNYCRIYIPDTSYQTFYIGAATASVNYSGGGMDTWTGYNRGDGAWWLHCYAYGLNEVRVKGFRQANDNNDSWWGGNPLVSSNGGANRITVCIFGYVTFK